MCNLDLKIFKIHYLTDAGVTKQQYKEIACEFYKSCSDGFHNFRIYPFLTKIHLTFFPQYPGIASPFETYTTVLMRPSISHSPLTVHFFPVFNITFWFSILEILSVVQKS